MESVSMQPFFFIYFLHISSRLFMFNTNFFRNVIKFVKLTHVFEIYYSFSFSLFCQLYFVIRHLHAQISIFHMSSIASIRQIRGIKTQWMAARRRWPPVKKVRERKRERGGARVPGSDRERRRRNELKAHTVAATGDLWWDYRWRYFFITVSPGRLSFFLFSPSSHSGYHPPRPSDLLSSGLAGPAGLAARSSFGFFPTLPISPCVGNVHASRARRSARGGLYLNNIHELRYTRQIYYPGTRGFCEDSKPLASRRSSRVPPFLCFPCVPLPSFFSSLGSPFVSWPAQSTLYGGGSTLLVANVFRR